MNNKTEKEAAMKSLTVFAWKLLLPLILNTWTFTIVVSTVTTSLELENHLSHKSLELDRQVKTLGRFYNRCWVSMIKR